MEAAGRGVLVSRSAVLQMAGLLLCILPVRCGFRCDFLAPLSPEGATVWQPPAAKEG